MGGPFSLRCLSPLCSPAVGGGHTYPLAGILLPSQWVWSSLTPCRGKGVLWLGCFATQTKKGFCSGSVGVGQAYPLQGFCFRHSGCGAVCPLRGEWDSVAWPILVGWRPAGLGARAMRPVAEWRSESATKQGAAPDPRAARPSAERRSESATKQGAAPDRRAVAPVVPRR